MKIKNIIFKGQLSLGFFRKLIMTWWHISFSSCVNEAKICQGVPLCPQKEDLKWCKETPLTDWEPFVTYHIPDIDYWYCKLVKQPNRTNLQYQQIQKGHEQDKFYHCLNRYDENPFDKSRNQTKDSEQKWLDEVNGSCESEWERRCLGYRSDTCVAAISKCFQDHFFA